MFRVGIDVGSTYTKYCVMSEDRDIVDCFSERTPIRQREYFEQKMGRLGERYSNVKVVACGYGKLNVPQTMKKINELTALAKGAQYIHSKSSVILDIGGQDTKIISQYNGKLKDFFINDRCAAGSGMFLINTLRMLEMDFEDIQTNIMSDLKLSSVCAVFAQSEIVELIASNINEKEIIQAVVKQIFIQAKALLGKININNDILLSGGMTQIRDISDMASSVLGKKCIVKPYGKYMSAIGCALYGFSW